MCLGGQEGRNARIQEVLVHTEPPNTWSVEGLHWSKAKSHKGANRPLTASVFSRKGAPDEQFTNRRGKVSTERTNGANCKPRLCSMQFYCFSKPTAVVFSWSGFQSLRHRILGRASWTPERTSRNPLVLYMGKQKLSGREMTHQLLLIGQRQFEEEKPRVQSPGQTLLVL